MIVVQVKSKKRYGGCKKAGRMNSEYKRLLGSFREWLVALNYSNSTIESSYTATRHLIDYLQEQHVNTLSDVDKTVIKGFFDYLRARPNKRNGQLISESTIKSYRGNLRRFSKYLYETGNGYLEIEKQGKKVEYRPRQIFTRLEIKRLYEACEDDLLGIRDRAMLSVYYGCGLRKSEGANLNIKDVEFTRAMLFVSKGKNYKQRYVPMVGRVMSDLRNYLKYTRPFYATKATGNRLFVGYRGEQIEGFTMLERLHRLKKLAGIKRKAGLHSLRHSIATHLLQKGMSLEQIARFLGHSSLESTQIYTRILHENTEI